MFEYDSFIILSPGRTGSRYITSLITQAYKQQGIMLKYMKPGEKVIAIERFNIYHSHDLEILKLERNNTLVVLSIRDLIDSTFSWCIRQMGLVPSGINEDHFFIEKHQSLLEDLEQNIPSFHLDFNMFLSYYDNTKIFYQSLTKEDIENSIIIDYDLLNDTSVILDKLKLKVTRPMNWLPIKGPGTHQEWIKNWVDIENMVESLERRPEFFLNITK